jgi:serine/threonine-protein kinase
MKHISEPLPPPAIINTAMPASLEAVIMRALAKAPENRYQTAHEFAADLKRAIAGQHIEPVLPQHIAAPRPQAVAPTLSLDQMATLPSAPAIRPPVAAPAVRPRPRWLLPALAALALLLIGACAAFVTTDTARRILTAAMTQLLPTPTPAGTPAPTPTPDLTATYEAEATQFAVWMANYIATMGVTPTPSPTPTAIPTATPTPDLTATALAACVFDVVIVNDPPVRPAILAPGHQFTKRWRLKNRGTGGWTEGVTLVFASGDELEVIAKTQIASLAPGESTEVQITLQAPMDYATYTSEWQLQDDQGHPIGGRLRISCYVGPTPTPPPTATPTATPTPLFTATPTERLWMSVPNLVWCDASKSRGRLTWGRGGGPSTEYHYFYSRVAPQFELLHPEREFTGFPHVETYFTTSGTLVWPVPDNCCGGMYGHYRNPESGYEIVWRQVYFTAANCP